MTNAPEHKRMLADAEQVLADALDDSHGNGAYIVDKLGQWLTALLARERDAMRDWVRQEIAEAVVATDADGWQHNDSPNWLRDKIAALRARGYRRVNMPDPQPTAPTREEPYIPLEDGAILYTPSVPARPTDEAALLREQIANIVERYNHETMDYTDAAELAQEILALVQERYGAVVEALTAVRNAIANSPPNVWRDTYVRVCDDALAKVQR